MVYRGPFQAVTDDAGRTYLRGEVTSVPGGVAEVLRAGAAAEAFTFLGPDGSGGCCPGDA